MADDGGSSGYLRRELGILPPGDARNCLVAMAADGDPTTAELFSYRFPQGEGLAGHALGNLIIAALTDIEGSFPAALDAAGELLGSRGRVVPSTLQDVVLVAEDLDGARIVGQRNVAESATPIAHVRFDAGEATAYGPAIEAIAQADLVVIGPGSLFTSILPNFLAGGIREALLATRGRVVYVCNVANQRGETTGMDAADHLAALDRHGLAGAIDVMVVHRGSVDGLHADLDPVRAGEGVVALVRAAGVEPFLADVTDAADPRHHDRAALLRALVEVTR
jgi:uncharacterized cofD-like protein